MLCFGGSINVKGKQKTQATNETVLTMTRLSLTIPQVCELLLTPLITHKIEGFISDGPDGRLSPQEGSWNGVGETVNFDLSPLSISQVSIQSQF